MKKEIPVRANLSHAKLSIAERSELATGYFLGRVLPSAFVDSMTHVNGRVTTSELMKMTRVYFNEIKETRDRQLVAGAVAAYGRIKHAHMNRFFERLIKENWGMEVAAPQSDSQALSIA